jgi:hypothetical protein
MTLIDLIKKVDEKTATNNDLFEYYQVKNEDGFIFALEEKTKEAKNQTDLLSTSFAFIYEARSKKDFNPIEELYYFYAVILKGLYGIDSDEVKAIAYTLGTFKTVMFLDKILNNKDEVVFFKKLYHNYLDRKENIYFKIIDMFEHLQTLIADFKPEKIEEITKELMTKLAEFKG